jgi:hypothetical protein
MARPFLDFTALAAVLARLARFVELPFTGFSEATPDSTSFSWQISTTEFFTLIILLVPPLTCKNFEKRAGNHLEPHPANSDEPPL